MIEIKDASGHVYSRSKNLRGILDYSRRPFIRVTRLTVMHAGDSGGRLRVDWSNGHHVIAIFASHAVMLQWIKARRVFDGVPMGEGGTA